MQFLRQSTNTTEQFGPFVDETDGDTLETGLTISQADIRVSKNGAAFAQSSSAAGATHDENAMYAGTITLDDTNTLGRLKVMIFESGALPVWHEYSVVPANIWDSWFSTDKQQVDATQIEGSDATDQITAAANTTIEAYNLDHLTKTGVADTSDMTAEVADDTVLACLMSSSNTTSTFVVADDSLQGISEGAAGGGATAAQVWAYAIPASPTTNTAADYLQLIDAVIAGVTNTDTANQVAFKNRSGVEGRRVTFGSADGSRTASTIS